MNKPAALYARVSSDRQKENHTIASQVAALTQYAERNGYLVPPEWQFQDDGYSGATLVRPGLEALRDLATEGQIQAVLIYSPDRLSRKYAYKVLLAEELARCGVELIFLRAPSGATAETGSKKYVMDFRFAGQRVRETTGTQSVTLARLKEKKRRQKLEAGTAGIGTREQPRLLAVAAKEWQEAKKGKWSEGMQAIVANSLSHLLPILGKKLLIEIEANHIVGYQEARQAEGAANRTVNIEVATLRQIMRKHGAWDRIRPDVSMLLERLECGRALTAEEESVLLYECRQSRCRLLLPFVILALETGARFNTIRRLQWMNINFSDRSLRFGKDKTPAGTGRTVPLNARAFEVLKFWAQQFPNRVPEHYVFPSEKVGAAGNAFDTKVYDTDPIKPIGDIKEAWESSKRRTRRHCPQCSDGELTDKPKPALGYVCHGCGWETLDLPAGLVAVRFHDLRHTAVSRMIAARIPLPIIAKIVGWSAGTMAKMAARYGHFGIEDLRSAVESISTQKNPEIESAYPRFSPQS